MCWEAGSGIKGAGPSVLWFSFMSLGGEPAASGPADSWTTVADQPLRPRTIKEQSYPQTPAGWTSPPFPAEKRRVC